MGRLYLGVGYCSCVHCSRSYYSSSSKFPPLYKGGEGQPSYEIHPIHAPPLSLLGFSHTWLLEELRT